MLSSFWSITGAGLRLSPGIFPKDQNNKTKRNPKMPVNPQFDPEFGLLPQDLWSVEDEKEAQTEVMEEKAPKQATGTDEKPEEVPTKQLGVRARNRLSKALAEAWRESLREGKFICVPNDVWRWVASRCEPNDVLPFTLLLSYDLSWLWSNKGNRNRWGIETDG